MDTTARQAAIRQTAHVLRSELNDAEAGVGIDQLTEGVQIAGGREAFQALLESGRAARADGSREARQAHRERIIQVATEAVDSGR